jgi:glycyl-tRNA synthetase
MTRPPDTTDQIAKRRGLYWPSFEIYGGLSGFYTYGDPGTKLKRNIEKTWRDYFVRRQGFLEIEDPIINPEKVFRASGHLDHFKEHSTECTKCGRSYRADHLIEEKTGLENVEAMGPEAIRTLLRQHDVRCPHCGGPLNDPVLILTMFKTEIGATGGETGYARPEAAQGMFTNFRRAYLHAREKLPFAIAQTGKVLRNEISPRRGMTRVREYTIMELELFFDPQNPTCPWLHDVADEPIKLLTEDMETRGEKTPLETTISEALRNGQILTEWQAYFMGVSKRFVTHLGVPPDRQRFRAHLPAERSHYSAQTHDHEVHLENYGWLEVAGHAYRTDYDLRAHQQGSGEDMTALREDGTRFIPHVVEPSFGLDRLFIAALETSYTVRDKRNVLSLPRDLAPYRVSVLPLVTKDGLPEKTREVHEALLDAGIIAAYDESGSIGRRYARSDEIGTPIAVTVDYDTLKEDTVTLRDRDSWEQVRLPIKELACRLRAYFDYKLDFLGLGEKI